MTEKNKIILPGESIATEEEYACGENTYAKNGKIFATTMGVAEFDEINKEAKIIGKQVNKIQVGDIVIGQIMLVKESTAVVTLLKAENNKKITGQTTAQLPVRNVSNEYVRELKKTVKIGDIIRAQVAECSELGIDLITKGKGLGIIQAYCSICRSEMSFSAGKLMCISCGNIEDRKWFEKEDEYHPRPQREGGFDGEFRSHDRTNFGGGGFRGRSGFGRRDNSHSFGNRDRR